MCRSWRRSIVAESRGGVGQGGHRTGSFSVRARKTSSRSGVWTARVVDVDRLGVEAVEQRAQRLDAAVARELERQLLVVAAGVAERARGRLERVRVGEAEADVAAGDQPLELVRRALGDEPAVVEDGDPVGELVGLVQVLRGQEDGHAAGDEVADDLPHRAPAARVQAGGRLVEEDDPRDRRPGPSRGRAGAACRPSRSPAGLPAASTRSNRSSRSRGAPAALRAAEVVQVGHQDQVLLAGEQAVHGRELPGDADRRADRVGIAGRVLARHPELAAVGADQGREDLDDRGLAGAVGAEQREDRALGDVEVDAVEHEVVAVGLAQAGRCDRGSRSQRPPG